MTEIQKHLLKACRDLGLDIHFQYGLNFSSNCRFICHAYIPNLGAIKGMVIARSFEEIRPIAEELIENGYGYSILNAPDSEEIYDLDSYIELFSDWGWTGPQENKPAWINAIHDL